MYSSKESRRRSDHLLVNVSQVNQQLSLKKEQGRRV